MPTEQILHCWSAAFVVYVNDVDASSAGQHEGGKVGWTAGDRGLLHVNRFPATPHQGPTHTAICSFPPVGTKFNVLQGRGDASADYRSPMMVPRSLSRL